MKMFNLRLTKAYRHLLKEPEIETWLSLLEQNLNDQAGPMLEEMVEVVEDIREQRIIRPRGMN